MDVHVDVFRAVELNDPVHCREIETTRGDVRTDKKGVFRRGEALEDVETSGLLLFAVEMEEGETWMQFTECFKDESDLRRVSKRGITERTSTYLLAAAHKHHSLHLQMPLDETPQRIQFPLERHHRIHLRQSGRHHTLLSWPIHIDVKRVLKRKLGELCQLFRIRRTKQHRLSVLRIRHVRNDGLHRRQESHIQQPIRFIQDEHLDPVRLESNSAIEMLKDSSRSGNDDVHPAHSRTLIFEWLSADDHSGTKSVVSSK